MNNKHLPNILTCLNLLCGCVALVSAFHGNEVLLAAMIILAALFDFLDGLTARAFGAYSDLGKQLDSLADMVTFGAVPGMVLYNMMIRLSERELLGSNLLFELMKYFPFIVTVCAAYRLAKFNVDTRQANYFLGLPTPAAGIFISSFPLILRFDRFNLAPLFTNPYFIIAISIVISFLMISELPLFALKFKSLSWHENRIQFLFLIFSFLLLLFFGISGIPLIIVAYILFSILNYSVLNKAPA